MSIIPRGNKALGFTQFLPADLKLFSREALLDRMCMMLGGRAAEAVIFDSVTTGAQDDLQRVTKLARGLYTQYGMGSAVRACVCGVLSATACGSPAWNWT